MKLLILYIGEKEKFDKYLLGEVMRDIPGTQELQDGDFVDSIREWEFIDQQERTLIRLSKDLETISIPGTGDASLKVTLELQKRYPKSLRVVDDDYSFDRTQAAAIS